MFTTMSWVPSYFRMRLPICMNANTVAEKKGLRPARIKGTSGVNLTKGNPRMDPVTWEEFETTLTGRGLAVYESGGWMKIMKA